MEDKQVTKIRYASMIFLVEIAFDKNYFLGKKDSEKKQTFPSDILRVYTTLLLHSNSDRCQAKKIYNDVRLSLFRSHKFHLLSEDSKGKVVKEGHNNWNDLTVPNK